MAGLTPLLDTLLHQVLGKRVDLQPARALNEPVKPLQAAIAPQAVHSDSRLDPRALLPQSLLTGDAGHPAARPAADTAGGGSAATLQLSPAAREIASLLARYPAPPSVLQGSPLQSEPGAPPEPAVLARAVQGQIARSGLFYESHLALWYRGRLPLAQLALEPQMTDGPRPPVPSPGASAATPPAESDAPRGQSREEGTVARLPDTLASVLRHQLELLATPVVRWEGEVWEGLFLALAIFAPEVAWGDARSRGDGSAEGDAEDTEEQAWSTELVLDLAQRGRLQVRMTLVAQALTLELAAAAALSDSLAQRGEGLRTRLLDSGFQPVNLQFRTLADE